jgi:hypothetical protein
VFFAFIAVEINDIAQQLHDLLKAKIAKRICWLAACDTTSESVT